jgi:hypothetical protein
MCNVRIGRDAYCIVERAFAFALESVMLCALVYNPTIKDGNELQFKNTHNFLKKSKQWKFLI